MSSLLVAQKYKEIKSSMLDVKAFGKIIKLLFILCYIDEVTLLVQNPMRVDVLLLE